MSGRLHLTEIVPVSIERWSARKKSDTVVSMIKIFMQMGEANFQRSIFV